MPRRDYHPGDRRPWPSTRPQSDFYDEGAMAIQSPETKIALLEKDVSDLHADFENALRRIDAMEHERDRALIWGISALGTALLGLVTWVGNYIVSHITLKGG